MSPTPAPPPTAGSRRELLATTSVFASLPISGCSDDVFTDGTDGEGDTVEMMVENRTEELAEIGVRVEDADAARLFSRVHELDPGHLDSSAGVETTPASVTVHTREGVPATWEYAPDLDADCDGEDIGITLRSDGSIGSWYAC